MSGRIVNLSIQYKAIAVYNDTALYIFDSLVGIHPVVSHSCGPLDTLSVKCSHTGYAILAALPSNLHNCLFYEMLYVSVLLSFTKEF